MKILILSFYYEPDLCAGSFRCAALVDALMELLPDHAGVDVVTTLPNRYASYATEASKLEQINKLSISRIKLPNHASGMLDQARAFITYYKEAVKLVDAKDYDLVFATSSRLFTAFLGARVAREKNIPLYLDIRDIFVDTLNDVLSPFLRTLALPVLKYIERYTFAKPKKVNLVSEGFLPYFESRYPSLKFDFYTNGIDSDFIDIEIGKPVDDAFDNQVKTILYAGNIGEGQGLHKIVPELAQLLGDNYRIVIVGDGGRKKQLKEALEEHSTKNVELLNPVSRKKLIEYYRHADILFLHLNDYPAFEKVLPSKIFEYSVFGKPILAGVPGYSAGFIEQNVENAEIFPPCDAASAMNAISRLVDTHTPRSAFVEKYARSTIMRKMSRSILSLLKNE